jgi:hypothetical protein
VSLPGFERSSGSGILALSGASQNQFSNFYDNCSALLFLTAEQDITAFKRVSILIPGTQGIASPIAGILADSLMYSLSTNAADVLKSSTATFSFVAPIGAFSQTRSTLKILSTAGSSLAQAGDECMISLNFTASMRLFKGETIRILLPDFSLSSNLAWVTSRQDLVLSVSWYLSQLVILLQSDIVTGTVISGYIRGLSVPLAGIQPEISPIAISMNATSGPVDWTPVRHLQPVGAFLNLSRISFQPARAASATAINISLYSSMRIAKSSQLVLDLPFFSQDPSAPTAVFSSDPSGVNASISWNANTSQLTILLIDDIRRYQLASVVVRSQSGIRIPPHGLRENETSFRLSTDAPDGPVQYGIIRCPAPIGGETDFFHPFPA